MTTAITCPQCGGRYLRVSASAVCEYGCGRIVQDRETVEQAESMELAGPKQFQEVATHLRALKKLCEEKDVKR